MRHLRPILLLASAAVSSAAGDTARPRGVGPEFAKFYKDEGQFTCISNPSIQLDISQVNDDYCDCPDGSDEPGTAACSYLSTPVKSAGLSGDQNITLALPGYYCKNKGHRPSYVPFSNVNDGVCDYELCCDGSDEWDGVGGIKCENQCKEIGKEWKKQDDQRKKSMGIAGKRRKELVLEAVRLKKQLEEKVVVLDVEIRAADIKVGNLEKALTDVEKHEKGRVVRGPSKGNRVNVLAALAKDRIEELRESLLDVRGQRDDAKTKVKELELILSTFKEEYNPNFNDEGVKRAVKAWEDYAATTKSSTGEEDNIAVERDLDEISRADGEEHGIKWEEWEAEEESDVDVLYKFEEYLPKALRDWIDTKLRDLRVMLVENGILADNTGPQESRAVSDARNAFNAAKTDLENMQKDLASHREDLERDYGDEDIFRALKGSCIEKDSGEYVYELCWFDRTTQVAKKGGGKTGMGNFIRLDKIMVDEDLPPDGKGLGSGERIALRYENGQHCWNGPSRSTTVILACAESDEVWKVVEEEKCVYRMEVGTPVVCESTPNGKTKSAEKDEL